MPLATLADYVGCSVLWMFPTINALKTCFMLRKPAHTLSGRPIDLTEQRDNRLEEKVKTEKKVFHEQMGTESLHIVEVWNSGYASMNGDNLFRKRAVLLVVPGLDLVDTEAFHWVYKREFYYMINHVLLKVQMIKALSMTIGAIVFSMMMDLPFLSSILWVLVIGLSIESLCRHIVENRADSFANEHSSIEELQGGFRFLAAAHRESYKESLGQRWFKTLMQPTYWFRMRRISKALAKLGALHEVDENKVLALKNLFEKNNQEELLFIEARKQQVLRWIDADED